MSEKILIVDDNEQDIKSMTLFLNREGIEDIISAQSVQEATKKINEDNPDIIILDTVLPDGDGFSFCQQIKNTMGLKAKVILLTGQIDAIDSEKAILVGSDVYIVKTSDFSMLIDAVKNIS